MTDLAEIKAYLKDLNDWGFTDEHLSWLIAEVERQRLLIASIETRCDPAGDTATIAKLREDNGAFVQQLAALRAEHEAVVDGTIAADYHRLRAIGLAADILAALREGGSDE